MNRKEWLVIGFLIVVCLALLFGSYNQSKTDVFFDLVSKFSFAGLIAVVARLVGLAFTKIDSEKEKEREAYRRFLKFGMSDIHDPLTEAHIRDILGSSKDIKILKTWFPETPIIAEGLATAFENKASVTLLLLEPNSPMLEKRSLGAGKAKNHGSVHVMSALIDVERWVCKNKWGKVVQIGLYDEWSGCPVIWCDKRIFMGFYFRGKSSDCFPWIEVAENTELEKILNKQFDSLWEGSNNSKTLGIEEWLTQNIKKNSANTSL